MRTSNRVKNKLEFYLQFLEIFTVTKKFDITGNDIKVLAHLYHKHDRLLNQGMPREEIGKYILATEVRREISKDIGISLQSLTNSISKLRKERMLLGNDLFYFGNTLHSYMYKHNNFEFKVKFDVLQK